MQNVLNANDVMLQKIDILGLRIDKLERHRIED